MSTREIDAYVALTDLLRSAQSVAGLFEEAGLPIPVPLTRLLGGGQPSTYDGGIRKPRPPEQVQGLQDDWIWVPLKALQVRSLIVAILASEDAWMSGRTLMDQILKINPDQNTGSIMNGLAALIRDKTVSKQDGQLKAREPDRAPRKGESHAFGPPSVFSKQELAAHRRESIKYLLSSTYNKGGLQAMQIVRQLEEAEWVRAPKSKDLVKADLVALRHEEVIRQVPGKARKYELVK